MFFFSSLEIRCMKERSAYIIKKFYESKNHQKKQINTGGWVLYTLKIIPHWLNSWIITIKFNMPFAKK